jgi:RNA polymerase subunit RPABC4/transcription elongation factor Spt4
MNKTSNTTVDVAFHATDAVNGTNVLNITVMDDGTPGLMDWVLVTIEVKIEDGGDGGEDPVAPVLGLTASSGDHNIGDMIVITGTWSDANGDDIEMSVKWSFPGGDYLSGMFLTIGTKAEYDADTAAYDYIEINPNGNWTYTFDSGRYKKAFDDLAKLSGEAAASLLMPKLSKGTATFTFQANDDPDFFGIFGLDSNEVAYSANLKEKKDDDDDKEGNTMMIMLLLIIIIVIIIIVAAVAMKKKKKKAAAEEPAAEEGMAPPPEEGAVGAEGGMPPQEITCTTCGAMIPAGDATCPACGAAAPPVGEAPPAPMACATCGATIPEGSPTCPACGAPAPPPATAPEMPPGEGMPPEGAAMEAPDMMAPEGMPPEAPAEMPPAEAPPPEGMPPEAPAEMPPAEPPAEAPPPEGMPPAEPPAEAPPEDAAAAPPAGFANCPQCGGQLAVGTTPCPACGAALNW